MLKRKWMFFLACIFVAGLFGAVGCDQPEPTEEVLEELDDVAVIEEEVDEDPYEKIQREHLLLREIIDAYSGMHEANEEKGFYWPYFLYIPDNLKVDQKINFLVLPPSSPQPSDSLDYHIEQTKMIYDGLGKQFGQELEVVVITPVIPRFDKSPYPGDIKFGWIDPQRLKEPTIRREDGAIYQFDLQLLAMIEDLRDKFEADGLMANELFYLFGSSNGGDFTSRMLLLHPEKIQAAAFGGVSFPSVPVSSWNEVSLPYPSGTGGLEKITGKEFDLEAYNKTPIFVFRGSNDYNDFYEFSRPPYITALGNTARERNTAAKEIYESVGSNVEFRFYDLGHELSNEVLNDVFEFFAEHLPIDYYVRNQFFDRVVGDSSIAYIEPSMIEIGLPMMLRMVVIDPNLVSEDGYVRVSVELDSKENVGTVLHNLYDYFTVTESTEHRKNFEAGLIKGQQKEDYWEGFFMVTLPEDFIKMQIKASHEAQYHFEFEFSLVEPTNAED